MGAKDDGPPAKTRALYEKVDCDPALCRVHERQVRAHVGVREHGSQEESVEPENPPMRRCFAVPLWLVLLITWLPTLPTHAASQEPSETMVFVKGNRAEQVRAEGSVWRQSGSFIESTGAEGGLYGRLHFGAGPFTLRARMRISRLAGSEAALAIDAARFGFAGGADGRQLWVAGELLTPGGKRRLVAGTSGRVEDGKEFELEVERTADTLVFRVDGAVVHTVEVDPVRLGKFGFLPGEAKIRIDSLEATGDLCDPFDTYAERLSALKPAISEAIDRGVDFLIESQRRDGSWYFQNEKYPTGETSIAVYALVKSGLEKDHPAVLRGLRYLELAPCHETYAASCQLMALGACYDPAYRPRMQELLDQLLDWQTNGSWNYPWGNPDLSNTAFAALGLRAAHRVGVEVPARVWYALANSTLTYQERPHRISVLNSLGRRGKSQLSIAGFGYNPTARTMTGSMTTAGLTVLASCREVLGDELPNTLGTKMQKSIGLGVAWLGHHFSVEKNPNKGDWHYYYLYGLERVGSLLEAKHFGEHAWYFEGMQHLLKKQAADGSWSEKAKDLDTCFALLFLDRATSAPSSGKSRRKRERIYASESDDHPVSFRAANHKPMVLWITGFSEAVIAEHGHGEEGADGLHVQRVEYLVDDVVVETIEPDASAPWKDERFATRHTFLRHGEYQVNVRVTTFPPPGGEPGVILGEAFTAYVDDALESWMLPAIRDSADNLLRSVSVVASASSQQDARQGANQAFDARMDTRWLCAKGDASPELTVEIKRPVHVARLLFSQAARSSDELGACDRITEIEVRINRNKDTLRLELEPEELLKTVLELERSTLIRRLWVRIVAREEGTSLVGRAGFTEIEFLPPKE